MSNLLKSCKRNAGGLTWAEYIRTNFKRLCDRLSGKYDPSKHQEESKLCLSVRSGHVEFKTNEERLAYYRSHGLYRCDDYPGGDAAFEADVLSGRYHAKEGIMAEPPKEDAYAIARMEDGRFEVDLDFLEFGDSAVVRVAVAETCRKRGYSISRG